MHKPYGNVNSRAFTLIEVMVSVIIISVVIATLLQMQGNGSHMFAELTEKIKVNQFSSFIIGNDDYGFEKKSTTLDILLEDFNLEDDLRKELKEVEVEIIYKKLEQVDMLEDENEETNASNILEVGQTILKSKSSSFSILRFEFQ